MLFSSLTFLWIFLPIVLLGAFLLPKKAVNPFLVLASLFFYAWGEPIYILLMLFSIGINWGTGMLTERFAEKKKGILFANVALNLALLVFFKYSGMLVSLFNSAASRWGIGLQLETPQVALPIGISFFTFQAISYVADVYRGETPAQKKLLNVALYISFFPQLIAGPILRYRDVNEQIEHRTVTFDGFAEGVRRFIYGLGKKILLSNVFALSVDGLYAIPMDGRTGLMAWSAAVLYALQIYYDFSGYSDMAVGLGRMMGFRFCENFNYPYVSCSVQEFWRRWHISLSVWFKEYVYIPLGGNRKGKLRTYMNLVTVFFLTGAWHGAGLNFIFWGLWHGFFQIIERLGVNKLLKRIRPLAWLYTMLAVTFGWVFFRVENIAHALAVCKRMVLPWLYVRSTYPIESYVNLHTLAALAAGVLGAGVIQWAGRRLRLTDKWKNSLFETVFLAAVLLWCIASLASNTYNPFIYFKF
ncbi:MAG: MBOAT family protein [Clostridia bacterium]|nr:MBOAT family protein [Clostridia bacterium]